MSRDYQDLVMREQSINSTQVIGIDVFLIVLYVMKIDGWNRMRRKVYVDDPLFFSSSDGWLAGNLG